MNKKGFILVAICFLAIVLPIMSLARVSAQIPGENIVNQIGDVAQSSNANTYIRDQFGGLIMDSKLGPIINATGNFMTAMNPVLEPVLGLKFGWTMAFFFTLLIFGTLIYFVYIVVSLSNSYSRYGHTLFRIYPQYLPYAKWGAFILFVVIISLIRLPKFLANLLVVSLSNKYWALDNSLLGILFIFIIVVLFIFLIVYISALIARYNKFLISVNRDVALAEAEELSEAAIEAQEEKEAEEAETAKKEAAEKEAGISPGLSEEDRETLKEAKVLVDVLKKVRNRK